MGMRSSRPMPVTALPSIMWSRLSCCSTRPISTSSRLDKRLRRASFILAEKGDQQPRTLASAFIRPVSGDDILGWSIKKLQETREAMDKAYGPARADEVIE